MDDAKKLEKLNKDHILAWLDFLHAEVQGRLFDHRHGTVNPELCDPLAGFAARFGTEIGIPISTTSRKSKKVSEACIRAWTDYLRAVEAVRLLTKLCFEEDATTMKALYEEAMPGVLRAVMKEGVTFGIFQLSRLEGEPEQ
jgi:hypothetical protein